MSVHRRPGPPPMRCSAVVLARVVSMRRDGVSYAAIARALTADGIPKPAGGHGWQRNHVHRLLGTAAATSLLTEPDFVGGGAPGR